MPTNNIIDENEYLFAGHINHPEIEDDDTTQGVWRVLIVDDEPEIHKVTELALNGLVILNKGLEFLHAYSGNEAIELLKNQSDVAIILLDVVMETDDAGLIACKRIREELGLIDVRVILRTGQPGYAPEEHVIMQYDINDYRTKTELTRNKLLTSIFSAIRSYSQILQLSNSRNFLDALNNLNTLLISQPDLSNFVECLVKKSSELFKIEGDALLLIDHPIEKGEVSERGHWVAYGTGRFASSIAQRYENSLDTKVINLISQAISKESNIVENDGLVIYINAQSCSGVLYFDCNIKTDIPAQLLQTFVSNVASDLDNSLLLKKVSDIAYRDGLTNLPNRTRFIQLLDEYTVGHLAGNTVALVDLDHFSDINDGLGQEVGNSLLLSVAARLQQDLPSSIIVSRIGADIFGLIGDDKALDSDLLLSLFESPFHADEHVIPVNASIGYCRKLQNDKSGLVVLKHANIALNRAKKDMHSRYSFYRPEMEDETSWRLGMIRKLTTDFHDGKLRVWYQPQINVQSGKVVGIEALLRWPDDNGGYISPVTFIPLAEYSGLIVEIGAWVIEQSCKELQRLKSLSYHDLRVAINVSMPQFRNSDFVKNLLSTVEKFDVKPELIELEITESVVMDDPKTVVKALKQLKANKFTIAIDDFGTGFSSLSYLHQLPLDRIKVDREFIKDIGSGGDGIIAETVINLGQKLGLETIAEGIETQFQLDYVKNLGCDEVQGYFHAKPMPVDELETFLAKAN
ncbi:EAL domain-containing protein [uncultured Psychrosphaera sp.]|uniref:EAL domain-containing protein n=1 Tax=uncultured Psychrosphaera sp. TaxID=1403522 RepID=UPI00263610C0|nr:EAL domain-containing protein [uncultured Psychrosphaera sp.]